MSASFDNSIYSIPRQACNLKPFSLAIVLNAFRWIPNCGERMTKSTLFKALSWVPHARALTSIFGYPAGFKPSEILLAATAEDPAPKHNTRTLYFLFLSSASGSSLGRTLARSCCGETGWAVHGETPSINDWFCLINVSFQTVWVFSLTCFQYLLFKSSILV